MKGRLLNKIIKECGTPEDFVFEYIGSGSLLTDIRRMREYVKCVNKVEREYNLSKIKK